tara:strand:+ start:326 stop:496 length:171 start_codon:yes stop_codon:yes gene_type:complete
MILYTEKQLVEAYSKLVSKMTIAGYESMVPTLEEFRKIYESEWEQHYEDEYGGEIH